MDFLLTLTNKTNDYVSKIKDSCFIEGNKIVKQKGEFYESIIEVFLKLNEIEYNVLEENQKHTFLIDTKLKIASNLNLSNINTKVLRPELIQKGLQETNNFSSKHKKFSRRDLNPGLQGENLVY